MVYVIMHITQRTSEKKIKNIFMKLTHYSHYFNKITKCYTLLKIFFKKLENPLKNTYKPLL